MASRRTFTNSTGVDYSPPFPLDPASPSSRRSSVLQRDHASSAIGSSPMGQRGGENWNHAAVKSNAFAKQPPTAPKSMRQNISPPPISRSELYRFGRDRPAPIPTTKDMRRDSGRHNDEIRGNTRHYSPRNWYRSPSSHRRERSTDDSRDRGRGHSRERSRSPWRGRSRDNLRGGWRDWSRDRSREWSRDRSRDDWGARERDWPRNELRGRSRDRPSDLLPRWRSPTGAYRDEYDSYRPRPARGRRDSISKLSNQQREGASKAAATNELQKVTHTKLTEEGVSEARAKLIAAITTDTTTSNPLPTTTQEQMVPKRGVACSPPDHEDGRYSDGEIGTNLEESRKNRLRKTQVEMTITIPPHHDAYTPHTKKSEDRIAPDALGNKTVCEGEKCLDSIEEDNHVEPPLEPGTFRKPHPPDITRSSREEITSTPSTGTTSSRNKNICRACRKPGSTVTSLVNCKLCRKGYHDSCGNPKPRESECLEDFICGRCIRKQEAVAAKVDSERSTLDHYSPPDVLGPLSPPLPSRTSADLLDTIQSAANTSEIDKSRSDRSSADRCTLLDNLVVDESHLPVSSAIFTPLADSSSSMAHSGLTAPESCVEILVSASKDIRTNLPEVIEPPRVRDEILTLAPKVPKGSNTYPMGDTYKGITCPSWRTGGCWLIEAHCIFAHRITGWDPPDRSGHAQARAFTCPEWRRGQCNRPERQCNYSHADTGLQIGPDGKTSVGHVTCWFWKFRKRCLTDKCHFAHADTGALAWQPLENSKRSRGPNSLKEFMCPRFEVQGRCFFADVKDSCPYTHDFSALSCYDMYSVEQVSHRRENAIGGQELTSVRTQVNCDRTSSLEEGWRQSSVTDTEQAAQPSKSVLVAERASSQPIQPPIGPENHVALPQSVTKDPRRQRPAAREQPAQHSTTGHTEQSTTATIVERVTAPANAVPLTDRAPSQSVRELRELAPFQTTTTALPRQRAVAQENPAEQSVTEQTETHLDVVQMNPGDNTQLQPGIAHVENQLPAEQTTANPADGQLNPMNALQNEPRFETAQMGPASSHERPIVPPRSRGKARRGGSHFRPSLGRIRTAPAVTRDLAPTVSSDTLLIIDQRSEIGKVSFNTECSPLTSSIAKHGAESSSSIERKLCEGCSRQIISAGTRCVSCSKMQQEQAAKGGTTSDVQGNDAKNVVDQQSITIEDDDMFDSPAAEKVVGEQESPTSGVVPVANINVNARKRSAKDNHMFVPNKRRSQMNQEAAINSLKQGTQGQPGRNSAAINSPNSTTGGVPSLDTLMSLAAQEKTTSERNSTEEAKESSCIRETIENFSNDGKEVTQRLLYPPNTAQSDLNRDLLTQVLGKRARDSSSITSTLSPSIDIASAEVPSLLPQKEPKITTIEQTGYPTPVEELERPVPRFSSIEDPKDKMVSPGVSLQRIVANVKNNSPRVFNPSQVWPRARKMAPSTGMARSTQITSEESGESDFGQSEESSETHFEQSNGNTERGVTFPRATQIQDITTADRPNISPESAPPQSDLTVNNGQSSSLQPDASGRPITPITRVEEIDTRSQPSRRCPLCTRKDTHKRCWHTMDGSGAADPTKSRKLLEDYVLKYGYDGPNWFKRSHWKEIREAAGQSLLEDFAPRNLDSLLTLPPKEVGGDSDQSAESENGLGSENSPLPMNEEEGEEEDEEDEVRSIRFASSSASHVSRKTATVASRAGSEMFRDVPSAKASVTSRISGSRPSFSPLTTLPGSRDASRTVTEGDQTRSQEDETIKRMKARAVMFEPDSEDEESEEERFEPLPPARIDPLWQRPARSRNVFDIDPALDTRNQANRSAAAHIPLSSTRPSKKKLMGNLLLYQSAERNHVYGNPHQEVRRLPQEVVVATIIQRGIDLDTPKGVNAATEKVTMPFRDFLGAPKEPVIEARDDQVVFREKGAMQQVAGRSGRRRRVMETEVFPFLHKVKSKK